jgi:hypothetical protein
MSGHTPEARTRAEELLLRKRMAEWIRRQHREYDPGYDSESGLEEEELDEFFEFEPYKHEPEDIDLPGWKPPPSVIADVHKNWMGTSPTWKGKLGVPLDMRQLSPQPGQDYRKEALRRLQHFG